jgi:hypothetical protein
MSSPPVFLPMSPPRPVFLGQTPVYPQGAIRSPTMQALMARRPIGVGGVADAVGTAVGLLEIIGTIAVVIVGVDILLKWAGHPLHDGR